MRRAKYLLPVAIVKSADLEKIGVAPIDGVTEYEVRPVSAQNPVLEEDGSPTGLFLSDYEGEVRA